MTFNVFGGTLNLAQSQSIPLPATHAKYSFNIHHPWNAMFVIMSDFKVPYRWRAFLAAVPHINGVFVESLSYFYLLLKTCLSETLSWHYFLFYVCLMLRRS